MAIFPRFILGSFNGGEARGGKKTLLCITSIKAFPIREARFAKSDNSACFGAVLTVENWSMAISLAEPQVAAPQQQCSALRPLPVWDCSDGMA